MQGKKNMNETETTTTVCDISRDSRHQWRIVENFYIEFSRSERTYAAYCIHCLQSKSIKLTNN